MVKRSGIPSRRSHLIAQLASSREFLIAVLAVAGMALHGILRWTHSPLQMANWPLYVVLAVGGTPLIWTLLKKLVRREFGSDLLAGISIVASTLLGEYLAGSLVVLMLSGGEALEQYAIGRASSVLSALAKRMPSLAHKKSDAGFTDLALEDVQIGDELIILPHEICPVDGEVVSGHSVMDESYLTGEPYKISKSQGSSVISGAINGEGALVVRAEKLAKDSRFAKIMDVMRRAEQEKPSMRRLADSLGAWYTPTAVTISLIAWALSGDPIRFLAVLVIATPCPLLIAIPIAIIGSISLSAQRGIIIRNPAILEQINSCETIILDKTGTLTYGTPQVTTVQGIQGLTEEELIQFAGSVEKYSKHPLALAVLSELEKRKLIPLEVNEISEKPGQGLSAMVKGHSVFVSSRKQVAAKGWFKLEDFPPIKSGMECVVVVDENRLGIIRFHDAPRRDSQSFIAHLASKHRFQRVMIVSGDRESEVRYLADKVGIKEVYWSQSPEQKVEHVKAAVAQGKTIFVGDGINDAPALMSATVGIAFGQNSDITIESAGAVVLDSSLEKVDELFHIGRRMRQIALQSAVGGMALSIVGMFLAASGLLTPVAGAIGQEIIDVIAVVNSLRAAWPPSALTDYDA